MSPPGDIIKVARHACIVECLYRGNWFTAHQERHDGSDYPRGLKEKQIPLGARIFAVADTLDAVASDRPYPSAQPLSAARHEIQRWAGRQFDPEVAQVFLSIPEELLDRLRVEIAALG